MKHLTISLLLLIGILLQSRAQLTVADDNNVGIGVTEPVSELSIGGAGSTYSTLYVENNTTTSSQRAAHFYKSASGDTGGDYSLGVVGHILLTSGNKLIGASFNAYNSSPISSRRAFGVRGIAGNATSGYNYAVFGRLYGTNNGAAVYGCTDRIETNVTGQFAGYFKGDVKITGDLEVDGSYPSSDINLKKDIRLLSDEETRHIDRLKTLSAIKYKLKNPAELNDFDPAVLDTIKIDPRTIEYTSDKYTKDKIGLSAQDVQLIYPELVKEGSDGYLRMNYVGLIPILVEALKEQDEAIKLHDETILAQDEAIHAQASEIEVLREEIAKLQNPEKTQ